MRIAATGDIHYTEYLDKFKDELGKLSNVHLFLLSGDLTDKNDLDGFGEVLDAVKSAVQCPLIGVFGNEEYSQDRQKYKERFDIRLLEEETEVLEIEGQKIKIVGTTGSLDRPTWWQRTNLPQIWREYSDRVKEVEELLTGEEFAILLMHYAPTYETLKGENEKYYPEMGCRKYEEVILERRPNLVIHGHAHKGSSYALLTKRQTSLEDFGEDLPSVPVHNVAFPIEERIRVIEI